MVGARSGVARAVESRRYLARWCESASFSSDRSTPSSGRSSIRGNGSIFPARTVIVGEPAEGFVLRGEGITPLLLPGPYGQ